MSSFVPQSGDLVIVCHRNRVLVGMGKLHAERRGVRVVIAANGNDVLVKARQERPKAIILGNDLQNPTTEETVALLNADPSLKGVPVAVVKGKLPRWGELTKDFPGVPWRCEA